MPLPLCFDYCSFVISFKIGTCETYNFFLFQNCFDYSEFLKIPYEFKMEFSISTKNDIGILIEIALICRSLWVVLTS